jgi:hypothetical protein
MDAMNANKKWTNTSWIRALDIPASGITFAAGASLIGTAIAGSAVGLSGALIGAVWGVINELLSQKFRSAHSANKNG